MQTNFMSPSRRTHRLDFGSFVEGKEKEKAFLIGLSNSIAASTRI